MGVMEGYWKVIGCTPCRGRSTFQSQSNRTSPPPESTRSTSSWCWGGWTDRSTAWSSLSALCNRHITVGLVESWSEDGQDGEGDGDGDGGGGAVTVVT